MRSFVLLAAGAALVVAKESASGGGGVASQASAGSFSFLTGEGLFNHFYDGGRLLKAVISHGSSTLAGAAYDMIPPPQQAVVQKTYQDVYTQVEKLRKDNGLPSYGEVTQQMSDMFTLATGAIYKGLNEIRTALVPVEALAGAFTASFESAYPDLAGMLPRDILDLIVCMLYLSILFFYGVWPFFAAIFCCCCRGSKKEASTPRKPNGKTDMKSLSKKKQ